MTKTEQIWNDRRIRDFEKIREAKMLMNEHKTMNVPVELLVKNWRGEHMEAVVAWYNYKNFLSKTKMKKMVDFEDETKLRLLKQAFEAELADVANMCYLTYLGLNGYRELEENKDGKIQ